MYLSFLSVLPTVTIYRAGGVSGAGLRNLLYEHVCEPSHHGSLQGVQGIIGNPVDESLMAPRQ